MAEHRNETAQLTEAEKYALTQAVTNAGIRDARAVDYLHGVVEQFLAARLSNAAATAGRAEWGHRYPDGSVLADSSETVARSRAVISAARAGEPLVLMRRTVTDWEEADA